MKQIMMSALLFWLLVSGCNQANTSSEGRKKAVTTKGSIQPETKDIVTDNWPGDTVLQIKKGNNGTILIVSNKSVFRYDGKSFISLTGKLGSHQFRDALEDRENNLWFATSEDGVYCYNGKSFQHFTTRDGLANNQVTTIYEDKAGIIWLGTGGGLSRYDGKSFQHFTMKGEDWWRNFITVIMEDKAGKLWVATRGNVSVYDGKTFDTIGSNAFDVWSIIEDKNEQLWFGGYDGLRCYNGKTFVKFKHNTGYNFITEDRKGNIWTSGIVNGSWALSRYDKNSLKDTNPAVTEIMSGRPGTPSGILEANDGSIWFGINGGLYRYDGNSITDTRHIEGKN